MFLIIDPGEGVASTEDGSKQIDHVEALRINPDSIKLNGQFPMEMGCGSNHRAMFCDLAAKGTLGITTGTITNTVCRIITSKNKIRSKNTSRD